MDLDYLYYIPFVFVFGSIIILLTLALVYGKNYGPVRMRRDKYGRLVKTRDFKLTSKGWKMLGYIYGSFVFICILIALIIIISNFI